MDKELLRIAIIATGLIIMVSMVVSAYLKDKKAREDEFDFYDDEFDDEFDDEDEFEDDDIIEENPVASVKKPSMTQTLKNAYSQKIQQRQQSPHVDIKKEVKKEELSPEFHEQDEIDDEPTPRPSVAPSIIQFSVITKGNEDFNGADIFYALEELGLEYGSMKIFERIDENRFVHFGVACMLEPGTFPDTDIESFYCPGVVFFMQIDALDDRIAVFDDYISTIVLFAQRMNGVVLDHRRQVLTHEMVEAIRKSL